MLKYKQKCHFDTLLVINNNKNYYNFEKFNLKNKEKTKKMTKFIGTANYIIQCFIKCTDDYSCSKTKLEKLMVIADLKCMKNSQRLFNEIIVNKDCGLGFSYEFPRHLCGDIVIGQLESEEKKIDRQKLNVNGVCNSLYEAGINNLSSDERQLLDSVFLEFGAYSRDQLGRLLNEFKNELLSENVVDLEKCVELFASEKNFSNKIFAFIKSDC